jgi:hypothetical protein
MDILPLLITHGVCLAVGIAVGWAVFGSDSFGD